MVFFRKKTVEAPKKSRTRHEERSLSEIIHERVLTAEGWRRKTRAKAEPQPKKNPASK